MLEAAVWTLTVILMVTGLAGVVVPMVPGTLLILLGALAHKLLMPESISWAIIGYMAGFWALSIVADFGGVLLGTRLFGGSKWGMAGAGGGAFVGLFFSLPALIFGTVFGAMAAERLLGRKSTRDSLKSGIGAATGFVISTIARLICAAFMIGLFVAATLCVRPNESRTKAADLSLFQLAEGPALAMVGFERRHPAEGKTPGGTLPAEIAPNPT